MSFEIPPELSGLAHLTVCAAQVTSLTPVHVTGGRGGGGSLSWPEHYLQSGYVLLFSAFLWSLPLELPPCSKMHILLFFPCKFNACFIAVNQQEKKPVKTSLLTSHIFEADGVGCLNITQSSCQSIQSV